MDAVRQRVRRVGSELDGDERDRDVVVGRHVTQPHRRVGGVGHRLPEDRRRWHRPLFGGAGRDDLPGRDAMPGGRHRRAHALAAVQQRLVGAVHLPRRRRQRRPEVDDVHRLQLRQRLGRVPRRDVVRASHGDVRRGRRPLLRHGFGLDVPGVGSPARHPR